MKKRIAIAILFGIAILSLFFFYQKDSFTGFTISNSISQNQRVETNIGNIKTGDAFGDTTPVAVSNEDVDAMGQGMPYFVSPDAESVVTWVGELPEYVTFELKAPGITPFNENYIVLPLNTVIKTAKDLCVDLIGERIMAEEDSIFKWDTPTQKQELMFRCIFGGDGPNLEPGVPYLITVSDSGSWTQK